MRLWRTRWDVDGVGLGLWNLKNPTVKYIFWQGNTVGFCCLTWLCPVEHLEERRGFGAHARVNVRLGALDVVVQVVPKMM